MLKKFSVNTFILKQLKFVVYSEVEVFIHYNCQGIAHHSVFCISELESEFLKPEPVPVMKPAIQPLENILANLKSSSTFKPASQTEDISPEAQKVVQTLPNLTFMKSSVLMFPLHME